MGGPAIDAEDRDASMAAMAVDATLAMGLAGTEAEIGMEEVDASAAAAAQGFSACVYVSVRVPKAAKQPNSNNRAQRKGGMGERRTGKRTHSRLCVLGIGSHVLRCKLVQIDRRRH